MITYFVNTFESFDTEAFVRMLKRYDTNGVILVWNYSGVVRVEQSPSELGLRSTYRFFTPGTWTESSWVKWPSFLLLMSWIMARVFLRTKVKRFFLTGGDVLLWFAQVFKFFGRVEMTITTLDDWSFPPPASSIGDWVNRKKFLFNDRLLNAMDTKVLVLTPEILENRDRYWKGTTREKSILYEHRWAGLLEPKRTRKAAGGNEILLLGTMRKNFGLEILFDLIGELNREHDITLRVIGLESPLYREYKSACDASGASAFIKWRGYVETDKLVEETAQCFCGYDMQEYAVNNSKFVIPGRVVHYMQNRVIPVISEHSGAIVPYVREHGFGVVCQPTRAEIKRAILDAFENYPRYSENLDRFLTRNPYKFGVEKLMFL